MLLDPKLAPKALILLHEKYPDARLTWRDCVGQPKEHGKWVRVYNISVPLHTETVFSFFSGESRSAADAVLHAYSVLA